MPLANLFVCPLCERPLEDVGIVFARMGRKPTNREARRLARDGKRPPRVRYETRRKLECGHTIHIDKRPVFRNWRSPGVQDDLRRIRESRRAVGEAQGMALAHKDR